MWRLESPENHATACVNSGNDEDASDCLGPAIRYSASAASVTIEGKGNHLKDGYVYVSHGYNNDGTPDFRADTWRFQSAQVPSNGFKRWEHVAGPASPMQKRQDEAVQKNSFPEQRYGHSFSHLNLRSDAKDTVSMFVLFGGDDGGSNAGPGKQARSYVWGSYFSDVWVLPVVSDANLHRWYESEVTVKTPGLKKPLPRSLHSAIVVPRSSLIYVYGGLIAPAGKGSALQDTNELWTLSLEKEKSEDGGCAYKHTWNKIHTATSAPKISGRHAHSSVHFMGKIYVYGGAQLHCETKADAATKGTNALGSTCTLNDLWTYDLAKGQWSENSITEIKSVQVLRGSQHNFGIGPRSHASAVVQGRCMFVFGGGVCDPACKLDNELWEYSFETDKWYQHPSTKTSDTEENTGASWPMHRYRHNLVALGRRLVLFGGESYKPAVYHNDLWSFPVPDRCFTGIVENNADLWNLRISNLPTNTSSRGVNLGGIMRLGDTGHGLRLIDMASIFALCMFFTIVYRHCFHRRRTSRDSKRSK